MKFNINQSVSDIVRLDYRTADVFKKNLINFCCSGKVALKDACEVRNMDLSNILDELEIATRNYRLPNTLPFHNWKIDFLADYIINIHHAFIYKAVPTLETQMFSFMEGHKKKYPEWVEIHEIFGELFNVLMEQNHHEEEVIFPYIKNIQEGKISKMTFNNSTENELQDLLNNCKEQKDMAMELMEKIKALTNNFVFPENACTNQQVLYYKLQELHDDMAQHYYLENEVLFQRAIEMEKETVAV